MNTVHVWLYSQGKAKLVHDFGQPIGDCICRFGLPQQVLSFSPDRAYLVDGQIGGKGSTPLTVIRASDGATVLTADIGAWAGLWAPTGHRLILLGPNNGGMQSWTPETGVQTMPGGNWIFAGGVSPDGSTLAFTRYIDPDTQVQPRVFAYDVEAGTSRMLVDKPRTQALFVKDGWAWYLEEHVCSQDESCPGGTRPTGNVFAMQLSTGVEQPVTFANGENPLSGGNWWVFSPGEYWPNS